MCERESIPSTFFEIVTALACLEFRRARVDAAVFEVGIGGRLDATNVLDTALSVITSVQMDHASLLGSTRSRIAAEKAGIFKKGVDALVAPGIPWNVVEVNEITYYIMCSYRKCTVGVIHLLNLRRGEVRRWAPRCIG